MDTVDFLTPFTLAEEHSNNKLSLNTDNCNQFILISSLWVLYFFPFCWRLRKMNTFSNVRGQAESNRTKLQKREATLSLLCLSLTISCFWNSLCDIYLSLLSSACASLVAHFNFVFLRHFHMWHYKIEKKHCFVCIDVSEPDTQINC